MNTYRLLLYHILFSVVSAALLALVTPAWALLAPGQQEVPVVVLERFTPPDSKDLAYLSPALTEMVKIRLESQGIDVIPADPKDEERISALSSVAELIMSGRITTQGGVVDLEVELRRMGSAASEASMPLKVWHVRSEDLGMLAQKTSLLTGQIADAIRTSHELMAAEAEKAKMASLEKAEGQDQDGEDLELSRMHPDKLVRERLASDQEKERQKAIEEARAGAKKMKEDTRYWDPLPSPYYAENEELLEQDYHPEPIPEKKDGPERSWWSYLWPWGHENGDNGDEAALQEQETFQAATAQDVDLGEIEESKQPLVVPRDKLPVPPPEPVELTIPEPQSVEDVLRSATLVKKEKKREEKWYSFLMPWEDDTEDYDIILNKTDLEGRQGSQAGQSGGKLADSSTTSMVMGDFIEGISGNDEKQKAAAGPKGQMPGTDSTVAGGAGAKSAPQPQATPGGPSSDFGRPQGHAGGPIWQWE